MTSEQIHRDLWNWIADKKGRQKNEWPEWKANGGTIKAARSNCQACAIALRRVKNHRDKSTCDVCPIRKSIGYCGVADSIFYKWNKTGKQKYARKIASAKWE